MKLETPPTTHHDGFLLPSSASPGKQAITLPAIHLDTTIADLYTSNGIPGPFITTMYCVFGHMDLHPAFPRELVYPEDEEPVPYSSSPNDTTPELTKLRKVILGLKPLRRAFGLGNMDVLFFAPNINNEDIQCHQRLLTQQLAPSQRHHPRIINLDGGGGAVYVSDELRKATTGKKLLFWRPQGWMDNHDCLLSPREMYDLNSKMYLVTSGIRTPACEVVNLQKISLDDNSSNNNNIINTRPLPFVLKLCRAGCGFGTFIIRTEAQRRAAIVAMRTYKARGVGEVLVSEYIDLVRDLSVHFFIGAPGTRHDRGNPLIMGVTVQTLTSPKTNPKPDGNTLDSSEETSPSAAAEAEAVGQATWVGGHIDYTQQEELRSLVWDTVRDTASKMPETFVGWAGVDIVVERGEQGKQWVVDLNARFTGSMPICLMRGHFLEERGLALAQFAAVEYSGMDADEVYNKLRPLVETGQVVVTATAEVDEGVYMADVIWGGKDADELKEVEAWIRKRLA